MSTPITEIPISKFALAQLVRLQGHEGIVYRIVAGEWNFEKNTWYMRIRNILDKNHGGTFPESMLEKVEDDNAD